MASSAQVTKRRRGRRNENIVKRRKIRKKRKLKKLRATNPLYTLHK